MTKSVTIFGGFLEPNSKQAKDMFELGSFLSSYDDTTYYIGGLGGFAKSLIGVIENTRVSVVVVGSKQGKENGFVVQETNKIKAVYPDGYFGKKQKLFDSNVSAFLILPASDSSLGTMTEIIEAIDHIKSFDLMVGQKPRPVVFYGKYWRSFIEEILQSRINASTKDYIHFVDEKKYDKLAELLQLKK